jgi:hypothetical protein
MGAKEFVIKTTIKKHYLFDFPIKELVNDFVMMFEKEKQELLRIFEKRLEAVYGEPKFSDTIFNISDMIVYKYFNDGLPFIDKAFLKSSKFKQYPFFKKIKDLENASF